MAKRKKESDATVDDPALTAPPEERSDWGAKVDQPWTAPEVAEAASMPAAPSTETTRKKKSESTPSVLGFLSRVGGASTSHGPTPARGLLGKITAADLLAVGRGAPARLDPLVEGETPVATVDVPVLGPATPVDPVLTPEERLAKVVSMDVSTGNRNQRKSDRFPFAVRVEYSAAGRNSAEMADNLSATGMFIHTNTPLELEDPVVVNFSVPEMSFPLTFPARVKWVNAFGDLREAQTGMGLEFTALDERRKRALAAIIARLRATVGT